MHVTADPSERGNRNVYRQGPVSAPRECAECGKVRIIVGRGTCRTCYQRAYNARNPRVSLDHLRFLESYYRDHEPEAKGEDK